MMLGEIEHHCVWNLLRCSICLRLPLPIQGFSRCHRPSSPDRADEYFQVPLGFSWIPIGCKELPWPIIHHPDLPQVRLRVFYNSPRDFSDAAWNIFPNWSVGLEICRVVFLDLHALSELLKGLLKGERVIWTWRVVASLPKCHDLICSGCNTLRSEARIASGKHHSMLHQQKLCCSRTKSHFFDGWKRPFLSATNIDSKLLWFHFC